MAKKKRYTIASACPQCGCTFTSVLSEAELRERYGDLPNFDLECSACLAKFSTPAEKACPEWDAECRMRSGG